MKPEENNTSYSIVKDFEIFLDEVTDETSEDYDPAAAFDLEVVDRVYEAQRSFENLKELLEESDGYANQDEEILRKLAKTNEILDVIYSFWDK